MTIKAILNKHFWGTTNCDMEIEQACEEIKELLFNECFVDCDCLCKLVGLPKKYKIEKLEKIIYG